MNLGRPWNYPSECRICGGPTGQRRARGMCGCCYRRVSRNQQPRIVVPPIQRFWSKVEPEPNSGCWVWTAYVRRDGYGELQLGRGPGAILSHRFAYEYFIGAIPPGLTLDHKCRNRQCVNPAHLEPVSRRENILRGEGVSAKYARRSHCQRGHPLTPENLCAGVEKYGRRCRQCKRDVDRAFWPPVPKKHFCIRGHQLFGANLRIRRNGSRQCRACQLRRGALEHTASRLVRRALGKLCLRCRKQKPVGLYYERAGHRYEWCAECWSQIHGQGA